MAVAIIVSPCRASAESAAAHSSLFGYIFELAITKIVIQDIATITGDVNVKPPVIVKIGDRHAHAPASPGQTRRLGNVLERPVGFLVVQRHHWVATLAIAIHG